MTSKIDSNLSKCPIFVGSFKNFSGIWEGNNHLGMISVQSSIFGWMGIFFSNLSQTPIFTALWTARMQKSTLEKSIFFLKQTLLEMRCSNFKVNYGVQNVSISAVLGARICNLCYYSTDMFIWNRGMACLWREMCTFQSGVMQCKSAAMATPYWRFYTTIETFQMRYCITFYLKGH